MGKASESIGELGIIKLFRMIVIMDMVWICMSTFWASMPNNFKLKKFQHILYFLFVSLLGNLHLWLKHMYMDITKNTH
jgi:hypothetical protein